MQERAERGLVVVGDRFRLERLIVADAFGELWLAVDERDGARVCVRAIDPAWCVAPGASREVLCIARGPSAVRHPRLAALLGVLVEGERWYLVSEHYEGESLAERVARVGPLDARSARALAGELAAPLFALHAAGAVHGRLDPSRIILGANGAKIRDLGLGMLLGDDAEEWRPTIRDAEDPSVAFLSPEQARGEGPPTARSDVWALAAILHFAVTGASPYAAKTRGAQARAAGGAVTARVGSDSRLAAAISEGLARDPEARPSLLDVIERLRARRGRAGRAVFAALATIGVLALFLASRRDDPARARLETIASARSIAPPPRHEPMSVAMPATAPPPAKAVSVAAKPRAQRKPAAEPLFYGVTTPGF